jgi:hypothetical protein
MREMIAANKDVAGRIEKLSVQAGKPASYKRTGDAIWMLKQLREIGTGPC